MGALAVVQSIANDVALPRQTVSRYLDLLELIFVIKRVPAWSSNLTTRATSTPKLIVSDSGLGGRLIGMSEERAKDPTIPVRPLLENFAIGEVARQLTWAEEPVQLFHYRDRDQVEVDMVLEHAAGTVIGIEVKAAETVRAEDFRGLRHLSNRLGDRFRAGIVLYAGEQQLSFGDRLTALPMAALWMLDGSASLATSARQCNPDPGSASPAGVLSLQRDRPMLHVAPAADTQAGVSTTFGAKYHSWVRADPSAHKSGKLRRAVIGLLAVVFVVVAGCTSPAAIRPKPAVDDRPNFVFVLTDDLSWNLVSHMPNLVALQQAGTTMSRYYVVDSLCCPSRSAIFTGQYPHDNGVFTNAGNDGGYFAFNRHGDQQKSFALALQRPATAPR